MDKLKIFGGFFALLSVILGAIAAHKLKDFLNEDSLKSFETGVKYMMYHGLAMLIFSQLPLALNPLIFRLFFWGVVLFSFSIIVLCLGKLTQFDFSFLGLVTPLGGILLIAGWAVLLWKSFK